MDREASGLRERIRLAIEAPVAEAEKLLNELTDADSETRLSILISGWSRGLASALEELAVAVDELQQPRSHAKPETGPATPVEKAVSDPTATEEQASRADLEERDEERLTDEARRSREQTAELQKQTEQARRDLEG
jgi:multidrug resistance efflux pump